MRVTALMITTALGLAALTAGQAQAAPPTGGNLAQHTTPDFVQQAQIYLYGGRNYCWYGDGWKGPGYYYCGYAWRRGYGWGGGYGWRGWGGGVGPSVRYYDGYRGERRYEGRGYYGRR